MTLRNFLSTVFIACIVFGLWKIAFSFTGEPQTTSLHTNEVVLYGTDWCPYCKRTKVFFKENNITYIEYDVEKSTEGKAEYNQLNGRGVPLVIINGKLIRGYDLSAMKKLLNI